MEQTLAMGYTTLRDAGWLDAGFKLAVEEGLIPGPRLVIATSPISATGAWRTSAVPRDITSHLTPALVFLLAWPTG